MAADQAGPLAGPGAGCQAPGRMPKHRPCGTAAQAAGPQVRDNPAAGLPARLPHHQSPVPLPRMPPALMAPWRSSRRGIRLTARAGRIDRVPPGGPAVAAYSLRPLEALSHGRSRWYRPERGRPRGAADRPGSHACLAEPTLWHLWANALAHVQPYPVRAGLVACVRVARVRTVAPGSASLRRPSALQGRRSLRPALTESVSAADDRVLPVVSRFCCYQPPVAD